MLSTSQKLVLVVLEAKLKSIFYVEFFRKKKTMLIPLDLFIPQFRIHGKLIPIR